MLGAPKIAGRRAFLLARGGFAQEPPSCTKTGLSALPVTLSRFAVLASLGAPKKSSLRKTLAHVFVAFCERVGPGRLDSGHGRSSANRTSPNGDRMANNMEPIFRVVRRQTIEDEIIVYARGAGAASPGAQNSARMAKRQSTIPTSPASRRKPRPKPAETFPWGWMWGSALALLIFALGLLAPGDTWKLPYAIGVVAGIFFALTGLSFQWRQSHMAAGVRAADKLCRALKACGAGFGLLFIVFIGITIWVWLIAATVRPLQFNPSPSLGCSIRRHRWFRQKARLRSRTG